MRSTHPPARTRAGRAASERSPGAAAQRPPGAWSRARSGGNEHLSQPYSRGIRRRSPSERQRSRRVETRCAEGRDDAEHESTHKRDEQAERKDVHIDAHLIEARQRGRKQGAHQRVSDRRHEHACRAADDREAAALGEQLTDQPRASGAERGAHRELGVTPRPSCQHAGSRHWHRRSGTPSPRRRAPGAARGAPVARTWCRTACRSATPQLVLVAGNSCSMAAATARISSRACSSVTPRRNRPTTRSVWLPRFSCVRSITIGRKICASAAARGLRPSDFAERPRHDADDLIAFAVERDRAPDDAGVAAKPASPQRLAEHHDSRDWPRCSSSGCRVRPNDRRDPQHVEQRRRHEAAAQQLGIPVVRQRGGRAPQRRRSPRSSCERSAHDR